MKRSATHLVLIPSYNPGRLVYATVRAAREYWSPVWVVVDGSDDGTAEGLQELAKADRELRVIVMPRNGGKGRAVLHGMKAAAAEGFTHVLTMDSDGQHPAIRIPDFMGFSESNPGAMILGDPIFDSSAPMIRVKGRKLSNFWANVETPGVGRIGDSLFGFRVYPIAELVAIMRWQPWMRRFDFDPEAVVRLAWRGIQPINVPAAVRYPRAEDGGVSHFNYLRDNILLTWMHARLLFETILRVPLLIVRSFLRRQESRGPSGA